MQLKTVEIDNYTHIIVPINVLNSSTVGVHLAITIDCPKKAHVVLSGAKVVSYQETETNLLIVRGTGHC